MKSLMRWVGIVSLAAFLGLTVAESFHQHQTLQPTSECALCVIAQQAPAISQAPVLPPPVMQAMRIEPVSFYQSSFLFNLEVHSLSPPVA